MKEIKLVEVGIEAFSSGLTGHYLDFASPKPRKARTFFNGRLTREFLVATPKKFLIRGKKLIFNSAIWAMIDSSRKIFTREQITHNSYTPTTEWCKGAERSSIIDQTGCVRIDLESDSTFVPGRTYLYLANPNFGHDFFEVQTRQRMHRMAERVGFDGYAVIKGASRLNEWIELNRLTKKPILEMVRNKNYIFEEVLFSGTLFGRNHQKANLIDSDGLCHVRNNVWEMVEAGSSVPLLYISRHDAAHRRPINELDIISKVKLLGGVEFSGSNLTLREQVKLITSSQVIIAPIGAGTTITNLGRPSSRIIELSTPELFGAFNSVVGASIIGQEYLRVDCAAVSNGDVPKLKQDYVIPESFIKNLGLFL